MSNSENRRIVLASRPTGAPTPDNFRIETQALPVPAQGEMLLRTICLSLDPYMRGRMSDAPSYAPPVAIGEVMVGSTVSRVEISHHPDFAIGDLVLSQSGWQEYAISDGKASSTLARSGTSFLCPRRTRDAWVHCLYGLAGDWSAGKAGRR
jgi:NADPH-dependent curcumin reductase CurA